MAAAPHPNLSGHYNLIWDLVAFERAAARQLGFDRQEVIVHCSLCVVEQDERNDPLVPK